MTIQMARRPEAATLAVGEQARSHIRAVDRNSESTSCVASDASQSAVARSRSSPRAQERGHGPCTHASQVNEYVDTPSERDADREPSPCRPLRRRRAVPNAPRHREVRWPCGCAGCRGDRWGRRRHEKTAREAGERRDLRSHGGDAAFPRRQDAAFLDITAAPALIRVDRVTGARGWTCRGSRPDVDCVQNVEASFCGRPSNRRRRGPAHAEQSRSREF
jgi:hypothetical protein